MTAKAVRQGGSTGLQLLQLVGANARYFTDSSQKPPIDVAAGDCAAGMCIDFYGREQQEAVRRRNGGEDRLGFVSPDGGSGLLGGPDRAPEGGTAPAVALAFIEYTLSLEARRSGISRRARPGGPQHFALRRLPVRRDFYAEEDWAHVPERPGHQPLFAAPGCSCTRTTGPGSSSRSSRWLSGSSPRTPIPSWSAPGARSSPRPSRPGPGPWRSCRTLSAVDYDQSLGPITKALDLQEPGGRDPALKGPGRPVPKALPPRRGDRPGRGVAGRPRAGRRRPRRTRPCRVP